MIVFSEVGAGRTASELDRARCERAAELQGCRIVPIPSDFAISGGVEPALARLPTFAAPRLAVWLGFIPTPERYIALHGAAARRNIRLLNDPAQHLRAQEFDRMYPHVEGLTPTSVVIRSAGDIPRAADALGFPIFVKGAVQSRKARGLAACLARDLGELKTLTAQLLCLEARSRGRVVARRYVPLRHTRMAGQFPQGREYRVFLHDAEVLAWGYYWDEPDDLAPLDAAEEQAVLDLACETARRLGTPYIAVDIGQAEDGRWWLIETGDAQFAGLSQTPALQLWAALAALDARRR